MNKKFRYLGQQKSGSSEELDTFLCPPNISSVIFSCDELTSFCPVTKQPDFSTVLISFAPDKLCLESKSLKLYLWSFREKQLFGEVLASEIANHIATTISPKRIEVQIVQGIRGGLQMTAKAVIENE